MARYMSTTAFPLIYGHHLLPHSLTRGARLDIRDSYKGAFPISELGDSLTLLEVYPCRINSQLLQLFLFHLALLEVLPKEA